MKLCCISDTHRGSKAIQYLYDADVLVFAGDEDILSLGDLIKFLGWFSKFPHRYKVWIAGNHDLFLEGNYEAVKKLSEEHGVIYLENSEVVIDGFKFYGSPVTPQFFSWAFMKARGDEITKTWEQIPKDTDVLITHGPSLAKLDINGRGEVCGCYDLGRFIKKIRPLVHIFGHIHGSYGKMEEKGIQYVNCSLVNEHYDLANEPIVVEIQKREAKNG